jgi:hypothetical protein
MRNSEGSSRGFGFVCYSTAEEAKNALLKMSGVQLSGVLNCLPLPVFEIRVRQDLVGVGCAI